ncbi:hypothetical protein [Roseateles sp.]|jgi:uncharacterized cupin superfamily protein|uniref:hypothetical protein n=1 Tax=Roseateles sp. TaxID=1971397 RepID=UPI0037CCAD5A
MRKLGGNVTGVAVGRTAYPFHSHRANDELFLILAGNSTLRLGEQRLPVKVGAYAGDDATGLTHLSRSDSQVGDWHGE